MPSSKSHNPRKKALNSLRSLLAKKFKEDDILPDIFQLDNKNQSINHGDRAIALIAATLLEQALQQAITTHLISLSEEEERNLFSEDKDAPLSSFGARIRLGYALEIFGSKTRDDLNCIRSIRNTFAHSFDNVDFTTSEIVAACNELHLPKQYKFGGIFSEPQNAREKFIFAARFIFMGIYVLEEDKEKPFKYKESKDWKVWLS